MTRPLSVAFRQDEVWVVAGSNGEAVKRVMGLPGETVAWSGPDLRVDGHTLDEPWVAHPERTGEGTHACGTDYLVLGDNRPVSRDGCEWGPLPPSDLLGRMLKEVPGFHGSQGPIR